MASRNGREVKLDQGLQAANRGESPLRASGSCGLYESLEEAESLSHPHCCPPPSCWELLGQVRPALTSRRGQSEAGVEERVPAQHGGAPPGRQPPLRLGLLRIPAHRAGLADKERFLVLLFLKGWQSIPQT